MAALSKNAKEILNDRYLLKDRNGTIIETPKQLFKRISKFLAFTEINNKSEWKK